MATPSSYEAVTNEETPNEPEIITHPFFSMTDDDMETDGVTDTFTDIEDSSGKFITLAGAIMDTAPEYPSDIPEAMFIIATPASEQVHTEETQAIVEEQSATIEEEIVAETNEVVVEATIADTEEIIDTIPAEEATNEEADFLAAEPVMEVAAVVVTADAETVAVTTNKRTKKVPKEEDEEYDIPAKTPADIIPEDWHGDKNYYTIGEVAEFFKVKTSHIRFWTNEFKMKVRTTRKGDRLFTPANVKELRAIYHLVKERGFTLAGAKTKLKTQNKRDVTTVDLKTSLTQLKNKLLILREQLI
jgi:DNA-binding transcriptional MerR regulator